MQESVCSWAGLYSKLNVCNNIVFFKETSICCSTDNLLFFQPDADYFRSNIAENMSERGTSRASVESKIINYFQDFLQEIECGGGLYVVLYFIINGIVYPKLKFNNTTHSQFVQDMTFLFFFTQNYREC